MKIKIDNQTDYDTKWLRVLFNRGLKMVNRRLKNKVRCLKDDIEVKVVYRNGIHQRVNGYAYINSYYVHLRLPRPEQRIKLKGWLPETIERIKKDREKVLEFLPKGVAKVFIHELYHCYGYRHADAMMFLPRKKIWVEHTFSYEWVDKYPVRIKPEEPKTAKSKPDIQMARYARVLTNLKKAETRLKRAKTLYQKWQHKRKYYEKALVLANKIPDKN